MSDALSKRIAGKVTPAAHRVTGGLNPFIFVRRRAPADRTEDLLAICDAPTLGAIKNLIDPSDSGRSAVRSPP